MRLIGGWRGDGVRWYQSWLQLGLRMPRVWHAILARSNGREFSPNLAADRMVKWGIVTNRRDNLLTDPEHL